MTGTADTSPGMQVAPDGTIFLAGNADNHDFPYTPVALMHQLYPSVLYGPTYLYAAAINPAHTGFIFSTNLGTGNVASTALDANGKFYIGGSFGGGSIPLKNALVSDISGGGYIVELDSTGALINSTAFGGHDTAQGPSGMAVDGSGNIYIAGVPGEGGASNSFLDPINIGTGSSYTDQADLG